MYLKTKHWKPFPSLLKSHGWKLGTLPPTTAGAQKTTNSEKPCLSICALLLIHKGCFLLYEFTHIMGSMGNIDTSCWVHRSVAATCVKKSVQFRRQDSVNKSLWLPTELIGWIFWGIPPGEGAVLRGRLLFSTLQYFTLLASFYCHACRGWFTLDLIL